MEMRNADTTITYTENLLKIQMTRSSDQAG